MAGLIPQGFIDDLLARTDIVEVIGDRIKLKKAGKNFSALCPFHNEKSPSFSVSPDKQFYYCFGCGAGGNAIGFLIDHDRLEFPEAVETLARQAGLEVPREEARQGKRQSSGVRQDNPLYPLLEVADTYYRQQLRHHPQRQRAVDYLKGRGLSGQIAKRFGLGFAPPGWDNLMTHLVREKHEVRQLIAAGLVIDNEESGRRYDRLRDRITFPIRDSRGRVVGFGGRVLGDDKPKYLNSPETAVFHKGRELYGLFEARQANRQLDEILVVEGYMDVIALAQQGITQAVATLGTATTADHLQRLFRVVQQVVFCFDGDNAGRKAAWRALENALPAMQDGRQIRFLFLPEGEDPDSLVRREGADAFRARMAQQSLPLSDYLLRHLSADIHTESLEGKAHLASLALPLIEQIPGTLLKRLLRQELERRTGMDLDSLPTTAPMPTPENDEQPPAWHDYPDRDEDDSHNLWPEPPRRKATQTRSTHQVDSPLIKATRTLLHHPHLATLVDQAEQLADEDSDEGQLLIALIRSLQQNPQQTTIQLLARWHGTAVGDQLGKLAEQEWLLDASSANLEKQFFDTIAILAARQDERHIEQLLENAATRPLSDEEKQQLRALLSRRKAPSADQ